MIMCFLLVRETYAPRLLHQKAMRLQKETGRRMKGKFDKGQTPSKAIMTAISRPAKLLMRSPIVGLLSLYVAIVYSYMYLLFTTFTNVFESQYGFNSGEAGLSYLGLGVGFCLSQVTVMRLSGWYRRRQLAKHGSNKSEDQLLPLVLGSTLLPIGLFWYGWSTKAHTHWIVPIIGTVFVGIGISYVFLPVQMYLIDAYTIYAASAIAANTIVRSIFGAVIPLAGSSLYSRLGLGWGNTLLGFIAVVFAPGSWLLLKYGDRIRNNPRFQPKL
jgi:MFS family permease